MTSLSPQDALARKERLDLSFSELGRRIGVSHTAVIKVLREEDSDIEINRDKILRQLVEVMDAIESARFAA